MQLDQLRLHVRQRTEWEALELGRTMLRAWAGPVYRAWCATFFPFATVVTLALWSWPGLAGVVIWWAKPVFDRVLLHVYSQCAFGVEPSVGAVYRALPAVLRGTGLFTSLTWRRLSPMRSFVLPIWQLERQRGPAARSRARLLARHVSLYAVWLTLLCAVMAVVLQVSQVLLFEWLKPVGQDGWFSWRGFTSDSLGRHVLTLLTVFGATASSAVEPIYIASGFSLYLNRRAQLEAWDIEIRLRSLAQRRHQEQPSKVAHAVGASGAAVLVLALAAGAAFAQASDPQAPPGGGRGAVAETTAKRTIGEVLRDPAFGVERQVLEWRLKRSPREEAESSIPAWLRWLRAVVEAVAAFGRYVVGLAAGAAVAWLVYYWQRTRSRILVNGKEAAPTVLFGLDIRPESLPSDVAARARQLALAGDLTAALALLYRGALVALVHSAGVSFKDGDTERDCLRRAADALRGHDLVYFGALVRSWQQAAYARRTPQRDLVLGLCDEWPASFVVAEGQA